MSKSKDPFAPVYAAPDDDAPREAVAQALEEKGDPRGELIRIQLARGRGERVKKPDAALERALLKSHAKAWLEPLEDALVASTVRWERGFPSEGRLNLSGAWLKRAAAGARPHPLASVPALATLRRLKLTSPNTLLDTAEAERIVMLPALRHLREIDGVPRRLLPTVATARPPFALERIGVLQPGGDEKAEPTERARLDEALDAGGGLPRLSDLELTWSYADRPEHYAWLWTTDLGRRLRVLRMWTYYLGRVLPPWAHALNERAKEIALEELELHHGMFTVSLRRTAAGGFRSLTGELKDDRYGAGQREISEALAKLGAKAFDDVDVAGFKR